MGWDKFISVIIIIANLAVSQVPCILGEVYVSEAANQGNPDDYIEIKNIGSNECTLAGFQIDDSNNLEDFTFEEIILAPNEYWLGYEDEENSFSSGLGGGGDNIYFADNQGNITLIVIEQALETLDSIELSQSYSPDGIGCYTLPTPGEVNEECFIFVSGCTDSEAINYNANANADDGSCIYSTISCVLGDVYVSEGANKGVPDDFIEVKNGGNQECTLAGFQLDDSEELDDFTFGNIILSPGDYWVGYEDADDSFNSGLNAAGEQIIFADASDNALSITLNESMMNSDSLELSQSFDANGVGCYTLPTPGEPNANCFEECIIGDLNGDGGWNVLDIVTLANCVLAENCSEIEFGCAGDLNGDGGWNVLDIVTLTNCILAENCT